RINTTTTGDQSRPAVSSSVSGDFIVGWETADEDSTGLRAKLFDATRRALSDELILNTTTTGTQANLSLAMVSQGSFVAAWESPDADGTGITARLFNADGTPGSAELSVNTVTSGEQTSPVVAIDAQGRFVVSYNSGGEVKAQQFGQDGTRLGSELTVNSTTIGLQQSPAIAMTRDGRFVVSWEGPDSDGTGIFAQRYDNQASPVGSQISVNSYTTGNQYDPTVQVDADANFIVGWTSSQQDGQGEGVYAQRFNAAGIAQSNEFRLNDTSTGHQRDLSLAMRDDGVITATWTSSGQDGDGWGIYSTRRLDGRDYMNVTDTGAPVISNVRSVRHGEQSDAVSGRQLIEDVDQLIVSFSQNMSTAGGAAGVNSVTNPSNWILNEDGVWAPDAINSISYSLDPESYQYEALITFTSTLTQGSFVLVASENIQDTAGHSLDGNLDGIAGGNWQTSFTVHPDQLVNTNTDTDTGVPTVAMGADGRYVTTWASNGQDGDNWGVFAQRYNPDGTKNGDEFQVNTHTADHQHEPDVAMAADGRFVITWQSAHQDGSSWGIYAQRYNADGTPFGEEFRVNDHTGNQQEYPAVAMASNGDYVIGWTSHDFPYNTHPHYNDNGSYHRSFTWDNTNPAREQVIADYHHASERVLAAAIAPSGIYAFAVQHNSDTRFVIFDAQKNNIHGENSSKNVPLTGDQPDLAINHNGDIIYTWRNNDDIYAQIINSTNGDFIGTHFRVNQTTDGYQGNPSVSTYPDGQFLITWRG
ncbi:MAG: hypothetical protein GY917_16735, partial [Planctomycetaceae bacterium]|nr:hypothetical protein [Planctomycetaceae bacterium]